MATLEAGLRIDAGGIPDLADVMRAMGDAFDPEYGEAWTEAQCAGILGLPGARLLIARRGLEPAGFAMMRATAGEAELLLIAVRIPYRRQGIGAALLAQTLEDAASDGAHVMHLEVRDGNAAAHLYGEHGFVQVGRRRQYYRGVSGRTYDALTFKRRLCPNLFGASINT